VDLLESPVTPIKTDGIGDLKECCSLTIALEGIRAGFEDKPKLALCALCKIGSLCGKMPILTD